LLLLACCNRHSLGCATHVLVENILSIVAAAVLLYFDNLFLNNPYTCLYGSTTNCNQYSTYYSYSSGIYNPTYYTIKLACIKAQLACASVMLATNVIYIIIFIVIAIKTRNQSNDGVVLPYGTTPNYVRPQPVVSQIEPAVTQIQAPSAYGQRLIKCPNCHTRFPIT
jgi:hypothetical protein